MRIMIHTLMFLTLLLVFTFCDKEYKYWKNNEFESAINQYITYLDSVNNNLDSDYIYIEANQMNDSTKFNIYLWSGAYPFLNYSDKFIDFFKYKKHNVLLIGDFPNPVLRIKKNVKINVINDIIKKRFPKDYEKYIRDNNSVGPLLYDYMDMTLIFKQDQLFSLKRQYY